MHMGLSSVIKGLFYSEFDNIAGPQIVFQAPPNVLSNEAFDSVSSYIIIDKALCGKIITVCVQQMKIVGYPVCIEDDKYHRNALLFNIGFVFDPHMETAPYRPLLRKLGSLLESMEKESCFLSQQNSPEATKALLQVILPQILQDLTLYGECTIPVDAANIINLKIFPSLHDPAHVFDYQVPVALRDLRALLESSAGEWDLALQQIVPFVNGVKYVKKISLEADVEIAIVKKCLRQLLYYGCITMIDIFLHSNIYTTTPQIARLAADRVLQHECLSYITKSGQAKPSSASFAKIFALYCSLQPSLRMSDFCVVYAESLGQIDVRRFITFGLIYGFVRRVHRYPIQLTNNALLRPPSTATGPPAAPTASSPPAPVTLTPPGLNNPSTKRSFGPSKSNALEADILKMMDGEHQTDEICSSFLLRYADLEHLMAKTPHCFVVHK